MPPTAPQPAASTDAAPVLYNSAELPIPINDVRLVVKMEKDDGTTTDVIVRHVHGAGPYGQRQTGSHIPAHTRYATGTGTDMQDGKDLVIPWPEDNIENHFKHSEGDTTGQDVRSDTWAPGVLNEPLGYHFEVAANARRKGEATAPYNLGFVENRAEADNLQRVGLSGFVSQSKLDERRTRIARGIMKELQPKGKRESAFHDNNEWVKRKMLEDARSIWWRDRKILSPAAEAAERALQEKREQREAQNRKVTGMPAPDLQAGSTPAHNDVVVPQKMSLPLETLDLVKQMQAARLKMRYQQPDPRFKKRLAKMAM